MENNQALSFQGLVICDIIQCMVVEANALSYIKKIFPQGADINE